MSTDIQFSFLDIDNLFHGELCGFILVIVMNDQNSVDIFVLKTFHGRKLGFAIRKNVVHYQKGKKKEKRYYYFFHVSIVLKCPISFSYLWRYFSFMVFTCFCGVFFYYFF